MAVTTIHLPCDLLWAASLPAAAAKQRINKHALETIHIQLLPELGRIHIESTDGFIAFRAVMMGIADLEEQGHFSLPYEHFRKYSTGDVEVAIKRIEGRASTHQATSIKIHSKSGTLLIEDPPPMEYKYPNLDFKVFNTDIPFHMRLLRPLVYDIDLLETWHRILSKIGTRKDEKGALLTQMACGTHSEQIEFRATFRHDKSTLLRFVMMPTMLRDSSLFLFDSNEYIDGAESLKKLEESLA